jgi:hypothetical protein
MVNHLKALWRASRDDLIVALLAAALAVGFVVAGALSMP